MLVKSVNRIFDIMPLQFFSDARFPDNFSVLVSKKRFRLGCEQDSCSTNEAFGKCQTHMGRDRFSVVTETALQFMHLSMLSPRGGGDPGHM